jgi:hypothetical protein
MLRRSANSNISLAMQDFLGLRLRRVFQSIFWYPDWPLTDGCN